MAFGEVTGRVSGVERGRAREGVALLLSDWMKNKVVEWKEVSSRLMWVRVRMGRECWAFVSAYGPGCERSEEERDEFWNDLTRCVDGLTTRNYVVVLGDLNARVGDGEVEGVVGKYGVPGENESGERLLNMCVEQELVIGNSFFKKKEINKYTWIRVANGRVIVLRHHPDHTGNYTPVSGRGVGRTLMEESRRKVRRYPGFYAKA